MKKFITDIRTLAALLMAGAAFTACSSSDDNIIEQPQNPTEPQVYTMVIKASKGGDTTTRALQPGTDSETGKNTVDAYWSGDETIEVYQSGVKIGEATAAPSANGNTTITAELTSAPNPSSDLDFYLGGKTPDYTGQVGLLTGTNSISENYDYATDLVYSGAYTVDEINKKITPNEGSLPLTFGAAQQAIIKFTLKDKANDAAISPSALTVTDGTSTVSLTSIPATTYTANGAGVLYVAFPATGGAETITLTATVGSDTYTYTTSSAKTFVNGQYYEITVKMTKQGGAAEGHALSASAVGEIVGSDGKAYAVADKDNLPEGVTAVAMIAYVGTDSDCTHGLAIALADESDEKNYGAAGTACSGKAAVTGGTWRLPSEKDWQYMFIGCGSSESYIAPNPGTSKSYSELASKLNTAQGEALAGYYWSSTEFRPGIDAWNVNFVGGIAGFNYYDENYKFQVRACLAF